ncbi:hypothetical protein pb186bvf_013324 [Paramecium bursaria]
MGKQRANSLKDNQNSSLNRSLSKISLPPLKVQSQKPQWAYQDDYDFLKDGTKLFKLAEDDNSPYVNRKSMALKQLQQMDFNNVEDIEERFSYVLKYLKQTKIGNLYNIAVLVFAYVLSKHCQYEKAIQVWKKYLVFCNSARVFRYKIIAYKHLSELQVNQQNFNKSLIYAKKLLKYSLFFNDFNYELNAYEQIGKVYYYMNQPQIAKAFHEKFMEGYRLSDDSQIRVAAKRMLGFQIKQKQQLGQIDTDSDEEFEIEKIVDPKPMAPTHVRLKEVLLKDQHLWGHVRKMSEALGPINERVFDKRYFQMQLYTQFSNNQSVKNLLKNNQSYTQKNNAHKLVDKLIIDIQQF